MSPPETLQRWTDQRQRVTTGARSGHVIGYAAVDDNPYLARAQVEIATGKVEWLVFAHLRELGLHPKPQATP